jgi:hypothetical protein
MSMARVVITAVVLEGRSKSAVTRQGFQTSRRRYRRNEVT